MPRTGTGFLALKNEYPPSLPRHAYAIVVGHTAKIESSGDKKFSGIKEKFRRPLNLNQYVWSITSAFTADRAILRRFANLMVSMISHSLNTYRFLSPGG